VPFRSNVPPFLPIRPETTHSERRTELYGLLAKAVLRFKKRDRDHLSQDTGDSSLHFPRKRSGTAGPTHRRSA
jgi:hypothetical protein